MINTIRNQQIIAASHLNPCCKTIVFCEIVFVRYVQLDELKIQAAKCAPNSCTSLPRQSQIFDLLDAQNGKLMH